MNKGLTLILFLFSVLPSLAQKDTLWVHDLKQIVISKYRFESNTIGTRNDKVDSAFLHLYQSSTLASLLDLCSGLTIKSYGPGILATSTLRGGSSQQTALTWHGMSLNSPVNGLSDLNLIPGFLFDNVSVIPGVSGSLQGSGAISGGIGLENRVPSLQKNSRQLNSEVQQTFGSFHQITTGLKLNFNNKIWNHSAKVFYNTNENNYSYTNYAEAGNPKKTLSNASIKLVTILHESILNNQKIGTLKFGYWQTAANRQIPPTLLMLKSDAHQSDNNLRFLATWERVFKSINIKLQSMIQNDDLNYTDEDIGLGSNSKSLWLNHELEMRFKPTKNSNTSFGIMESNVNSKIYSNDRLTENSIKSQRDQIAIWGSHFHHFWQKRLLVNLGIRKEMLDRKPLPMIPCLGFKIKVNKQFDIFGQGSRVFRLPTLNDLYWTPGGNPNLKPELGWGSELSLQYQLEKKNVLFTTSMTAFNRDIKNWIQWQSVTSQIWSPFNIGSVKSRGVEFRSQLKFKIRKLIYLNWLLNADYTESFYSEKEHPNYEKQLFYVPFFKTSSIFGLTFKHTTLNLNGLWLGKRFITPDHTESLPAYGLLNVAIHQSVLSKNKEFNFFLKVNNVFNKSYQGIVWRPMPGINIEGGITLKFQKIYKS
jgi:vitamin B12 transporter